MTCCVRRDCEKNLLFRMCVHDDDYGVKMHMTVMIALFMWKHVSLFFILFFMLGGSCFLVSCHPCECMGKM